MKFLFFFNFLFFHRLSNFFDSRNLKKSVSKNQNFVDKISQDLNSEVYQKESFLTLFLMNSICFESKKFGAIHKTKRFRGNDRNNQKL